MAVVRRVVEAGPRVHRIEHQDLMDTEAPLLLVSEICKRKLSREFAGWMAHICAGLEEPEHAADLAVHGGEHQGSLQEQDKEKKMRFFRDLVGSYASERRF